MDAGLRERFVASLPRTAWLALGLLGFSVAATAALQLSIHRADLPPEAAWRPAPLVANVLLLGGYAAAWLLVIRRTAPAIAGAAGGVGALCLANFYKVRELGEPVMLFDVFQLRNAPVLFAYVPPGDWPLLGVGGVVICIALAWRGGPRANPPLLALPLVVLLAAAFVARSFATEGETWAKRAFATADVFWDPLSRSRANGFVVASLLDVPQLSIAVPERYEEGQERELLEPFLACDRSETRDARFPHVVVVMLESFWDPTTDGLTFDRDPLPVFRELRGRGASHQFVSPVFGSRTANAEFEVLTGMSTRFSPAGSIPYQQYVKRPIASVASVLGDSGYRSVAVHNFRRSFWNRDAVYPMLGFDEFLALEDLGEVPWELGWPSDAVLFDRVERILADADRPTFVFAVTVATHGPYSGRGLEPTIQLIDEARPELIGPMSVYASKLALLDRHFGDFVARLERMPEPPIVIAFADHLPTVAARALPADAEHRVPRSRVVEALILGAPTFPPDVSPRSMNCLGPEILRLAGVPAPPFFRFVDEVCAQLPVVTPATALDGDEELLRKYRWLTYDRLFGKGYSSGSCDPT